VLLKTDPERPALISCTALRRIFLLSDCLCSTLGRKNRFRTPFTLQVAAERSCYDDDEAEGRVFRLLLCAIAAIFRPRALLIAENLCQQLLVLQRRRPRPCLSNADRRFSILASRWFGVPGIHGYRRRPRGRREHACG
jgi:hypothetical protein